MIYPVNHHLQKKILYLLEKDSSLIMLLPDMSYEDFTIVCPLPNNVTVTKSDKLYKDQYSMREKAEWRFRRGDEY